MKPENGSVPLAAELYAELTQRGVQVRADGDELRLRAPRGGLPPELKARVVAHKSALLELLRAAEPGISLPQPPEAGEAAPLSWAQQGIWFQEQLAPGGGAYNVAIAVRLVGSLDVDALERALGEILQRHAVLRTRFGQRRSGLVQVSESLGSFVLQRLELGHHPDPEGEARRLAREEAERPFRLDEGPLWRAVLLMLGTREHRLLWTVHHAVFDGWSTRVLLRELGTLYTAFSTGARSPLPPPPLQFADFARRQKESSSGPGMEAQVAYWRERLGQAIPPLELPLDRTRPPVRTFRGERIAVELPARLAQTVESFCRAEGVTSFMMLLAAFKLLLYRLTGQGELCVGTPFADRQDSAQEALIGPFVQTLVIRTGLGDDPPFRVLLGRVRAATLEARENADVPFERLVAELRPARHPGRSPLFQVMFNLVNLPEPELELPGLRTEVSETLPGSRFELTLYAYPRPGALRLELAYDTGLFERQRMEALLEQMTVLLEQLVAEPGRRLGRYSLVGRKAAARLPDPARPLEARWMGSVLSRFALQARRVPHRVAVVGPRECWTYAELDARSRLLAHQLRAGGVRAGDVVAIFGHRSPALVGALLGTWRAGAAFLLLDPDYPAARLLNYLRVVQPVAFIQLEAAGVLPTALAASLESMSPRCRLQLSGDGSFPTGGVHAALEEPEEAPEGLAYVAFTSGSTGEPKAIAGTHLPLSHFLDWHVRASGLTEGERFSVLSGLSHDPLLRDLLTPLWLGATAVMPEEDERTRGRSLAEWLRRESISVLHVTPPLMELLVGEAGERPFPALRHVFFGGDVLGARMVRALRGCAPSARVVNFYGASETPQAMGFHPVPEPLPADAPECLPVGCGIDGVQLLVLGPGGALAGVGELGEIHVRTPYLARGYLGDEVATRERFLADPFAAEGPLGRMYRTGDLGRYRPDGTVELVGRADRQVKIRGHRVEPAEVERVLCEHPLVAKAAVVARANLAGETTLVAYLVPAPGQQTPMHLEILAGFLRARLPAALVPTAFISLVELPLTPNGKLDVAALPVPQAQSGVEGGLPRTPIEAVLARLWAEVLGKQEVGIHQGFFELGGHSLLAARLVARLRDAVGVELTLREVFDAGTVAALAARVEARWADDTREALPPLVPIPPGREEPRPSFAQQRLWLLERLGEPAQQVRQWVGLRGGVDVEALRRALVEVERRHEVLRTVIECVDGQPVPRLGATREWVLEVEELGHLPEEERREVVARWRSGEGERAPSLERGPVWSARLLRWGEAESWLLLSFHHAVADGGSMAVLWSELSSLYAAFRRGEEPRLAPLRIQYSDYAAWQRRCARSGAFQEELAFWRERLVGVPALELPTARPRPRTQGLRGGLRTLALPGKVVEGVRGLGRRDGATVYMVLLAAFEVVLWRYTGQEDFVVGSPVSSRIHTATEGLIGLFLEPVALRAKLSGELDFRALVGRVRRELLEACSHRKVPFEQVVEAVRPERDPGRTPVFQVFFNLLDVGAVRPVLEGLEVEALERPEPMARYDLTLHAVERAGGGMELALVHDQDLFEEVQAEALLNHLVALLEQVVEAPERRLGELRLEPVVRPRGPGRVLGGPAEGFTGFGPEALERSLAERFEEMVARHPERVAVSGRGARVTYAQLDARANRVSAELVRRLPEGGERVALLLAHDADMVAGILGVLKAGKVYVPLDGSFPDGRLAFIAGDAGARALVTRGDGVARARVLARPGCVVLDMDTLPESSRPRVTAPVDAYILYTSGSTGEPKGVVQSQRNVLAHLRNYSNRLFLGPSDRLSLLSPYSFDAAVMDILGAVLNGATLCPVDVRQGELPVLARRLREERVTIYHSTPTLYRHLVEQLAPGELLPDVRRVVLGGEEVLRRDVEAFRRCFRPDCVFVNGLGPTESTLALQFFLDGSTVLTRESVPVGAPVEGVEVVLRNGAGDQVAPYGTGELLLRGEHVACGYWNRPELTARAFSGEGPVREYRTGDWGRLLPDGLIEFAGRRDAQVKIRGHRAELGEIESQLRARAEGSEVLVLANDDPEGIRLAAFVVRPRGAPGPTSAELRRQLQDCLPGYMVPSSITLLDAFPLTATGKVDRQALRALQRELGSAASVPMPARDALEEELVGLWEELLGTRPVGVEAEFFELGGHSLLALRLLDRIEKRFGRRLPLVSLFQGATVARMARLLRDT